MLGSLTWSASAETVIKVLYMRILGREGMLAAYGGKNGGFTNPGIIKAFQLYQDLRHCNRFRRAIWRTLTQRQRAFFTMKRRPFISRGSGT
jgi:hypothetical protein